MIIEVLDLGCIIMSLKVPDKDNLLTDVVLGYQDPVRYFDNPPYFGAAIGRFSNRIAKGRFLWKDEEIQLETNDGDNHLHGGFNGFNYRIWECVESEECLTFRMNSPDGDSNYPGEVDCFVSYTLTDDNELVINYKVTTPTESIASLSNHSYFNLNGDGSPSVLNHYIKANSDLFTEIAPDAIPTGRLLPVEGTPMDFREFKTFGEEIDADYDQLKYTDGYDHNYVVKEGVDVDVIVYSPATGIQLELSTDSPGFQIYTGNTIDESLIGKTGKNYKRRSGFCLETQFYPDAPNHKDFPQPIVTKNQPQEFETRFKFSIKTIVI